ncbi:protein ENL-like isoform X2 [Galleria mellonella]|uniref:Protein ENL-like isoform X2 n=1 Tax=Galleria mellonella TaxID=7137 RepID=A0A6J3BNX8_GALME|nr:protein ENL-like isoform X2 [Galleria mellonella]
MMCVRIWLEVGHACEPRHSALGRALALDWRLWVRGISGHDISSFVHKVVFYLHPPSAFVYPKRVRQEPPYEIQESGCSSIDVPIHVYLKCNNEPKIIRLRYSLVIENNTKSSSESTCIYYDFENPSEQLWKALMKGGGEIIARAGNMTRGSKLVVLSDNGDDKLQTSIKKKKYKFVEPVRCKHGSKKKAKPYVADEVCTKCGDSVQEDLKKQLRSVSMAEDEITRVSELYLSYKVYEKSVEALTLPPLSDPIYKVPELPLSLREALKCAPIENAI